MALHGHKTFAGKVKAVQRSGKSKKSATKIIGKMVARGKHKKK